MRRAVIKIDVMPTQLKFKLLENDEVVYRLFEFNNYFYVYKDDEAIVNNLLNRFGTCEDFDDEYCKFILNNNYDRYKCVNILDDKDVKHFEADIEASKRFLIDNVSLDLGQEYLRKVFIDIETFDLKPLEKDDRGRAKGISPILSVAFKDFNGNKYYIYNKAFDEGYEDIKDLYLKYVENRNDLEVRNKIKSLQSKIENVLISGEKRLLQEFAFIMKNYELYFAYNGEGFDVPYLKDRFAYHNLNFDDLDIIHMDYYLIYKKNSWDKLKSYSLNNVALHEFRNELDAKDSKFGDIEEVTKIDWKEKTNLKSFFELYLLNPSLLKEYNLQDVELMHMIENKNNFIKIHEIQCRLGHCLIRETMFNSEVGDFMILNEAKRRQYVKNSRPNKIVVKQRQDPINGVFPSGGFTYCYIPGLHKYIHGFDAKSQYPTNIISFNISEDTFIKNIYPNLKIIFSEKEISLINYAVNVKKEFYNAKGELKKNKYDKAIDEKQKELDLTHNMTELMWKFIKEYNDPELKSYLKRNNFTMTPADINYDTRGWEIHPHRVFTNNTQGILPYICKYLITERDKTKYELKDVEYHSDTWWEKHIYQNGLKVAANSMFGIHGLKSFRDFNYDIADAITTSGRYQTKSVVVFAQEQGFYTTAGDTDSAYIGHQDDETYEEAVKRAKDMDVKLFDFFNLYADEFNTNVNIELTRPDTKEKINCKHFFVFEHEKTFYSVIFVKKKKYYYKHLMNDKFVYETMGGISKKSDTIKIAADLQRELVKNVLDDEFDKNEWKEKLLTLKRKVDNYELELEYIIKHSGLSKDADSYGQPMIDGKTGGPKINKDGSIRYAPVPAHVEVAKRLIQKGEDINIGDKIPYIIVESKPNVAISIDEYNENPRYDESYYWESIISPIIEILSVVYPDDVYTFFGECWGYNERVLKNKIKKMNEEEDDYEQENF